VLTTAPESIVFRADVSPLPAEARTVGGWQDPEVQELAGQPGVEVVTNDESCLEECSRLRAAAGRPAIPLDQLRAYMDKVELKTRLAAAGLAVPRFAVLEPGRASADDVASSVGMPAVVKPRRGAYNIGVEAVVTADELRDWLARHGDEAGWHVESFARGALFHANALVRGGRITPVVVGAYTGPPLAVMRGASLGSVTLPPQHPLSAVGFDVVRRVVAALGADGEFVVHVEFFFDGEEAVVIDVAARAPGGLVSDVAALATGVNLEEASFRLQAGREVAEPAATGLSAAWLWCAGTAAPRTTMLAWNRDFEQLLVDVEHSARAGGADEPGWLAGLRSLTPSTA
jgi:biotin carboxylase